MNDLAYLAQWVAKWKDGWTCPKCRGIYSSPPTCLMGHANNECCHHYQTAISPPPGQQGQEELGV